MLSKTTLTSSQIRTKWLVFKSFRSAFYTENVPYWVPGMHRIFLLRIKYSFSSIRYIFFLRLCTGARYSDLEWKPRKKNISIYLSIFRLCTTLIQNIYRNLLSKKCNFLACNKLLFSIIRTYYIMACICNSFLSSFWNINSIITVFSSLTLTRSIHDYTLVNQDTFSYYSMLFQSSKPNF